MLLSVDPGVRGCGCAVFDGRDLRAAGYVKNSVPHGQDVAAALAMGRDVRAWWASKSWGRPVLSDDRLVIEVPRVYDAAFQKGDQNTSTIPLSLVIGAVVGVVGLTCHQFFPRDWKGTLDGDTLIRDRIIPALSESERTRVQLPAASLAHNVWDGVGVGLKYLGRLEPRRAFHRES